jgi:hypothetical protein
MRKLSLLAALLLAANAHAQSLDDVVSKVMKEYGGTAAWQKVTTIRETGKVVRAMGGDGATTRFWQKPDKLRVEIVYPTNTEVRVVDGDHGTRDGKEATGGGLDAMKLQEARLELPLLLVAKRASLKDLGMHEAFRAIEIPISASLTVTIDIDPKSWHIVRSTGKTSGLEFIVDYSDFRRVGGLLFPFAEAGMAQGMPTANTKIEAIEINAPSAPPPPAGK